jgi:hypothetical protein
MYVCTGDFGKGLYCNKGFHINELDMDEKYAHIFDINAVKYFMRKEAIADAVKGFRTP